MEKERIVLAVTLDVDAGDDAKMLRGLFDRDADRQLDASEQEKMLDYLEETAFLWLRIEASGKKLSLVRRERQGLRIDLAAESTQNLGLSAVYEAPIPPAERLDLLVADRDKDGAKHVPLIVDLSSGDAVLSATQGEWHPSLRQLHRVRLRAEDPLLLSVRRTTTSTRGP